MPNPLRILHLEDSPLDSELILKALESEDLPCDMDRVETREALLTALDRGGYDLVLSDYHLPTFDGLSALTLVRERRPHLPFIMVTGTIGEMRAAEAVRNGATDFVLKDHLGRLVPSIRRALREVEMRKESEKLEAQLRQSQKMEAMGRLAGGVAHDFNNLLTAITGYGELLLRRMPTGDPLRREVDEIRKAAERASVLTRQLLAFSRKQPAKPVVFTLNEAAAGMDPMLRRLIGEDVDLLTTLDPAAGQVRADRGQIEQVLVNLVVNARDAMPKGGQITIATGSATLDAETGMREGPARPGPYVMLSVSDTGCGMDATTQSRLFEPFFTTKPAGKGTGLGLSTVYGIVKQHEGHLWVYSEPGVGTTIRVYLPRVSLGADEPAKPAETAAGAPRRRGTETILLVEDEAAVRALAKEVLEMEGYRVIEAPDGPQAVEAIERRQGPIHLMVTDTIMPHFGGRELAGRAKELLPDLRVLFMSGYTDEAVTRHGVLDPGTAFLQKPFSPDALARKVREALGGKSSPRS
ncbi:MAG: response regulator [Planctomycetes bacterium]|nr:response regulator [Planctomycetota bacterium]